jgi:hypothetical protein
MAHCREQVAIGQIVSPGFQQRVFSCNWQNCPCTEQIAVVKQSRILLDKGLGVKKSKKESSCKRMFLQLCKIDGLCGLEVERKECTGDLPIGVF